MIPDVELVGSGAVGPQMLRSSGLKYEGGRGFTLIEVVVAMLILATSGLVLFSWINQNLETATRLRDAQARAQLQIEGVAWLQTINPALEEDGEREQDGLRLKWRATPVESMRPEDTYGGNLVPRWMVGLYEVEAWIMRPKDGVQATWRQHLAGWRPANYTSSQSSAVASGGAPAPVRGN